MVSHEAAQEVLVGPSVSGGGRHKMATRMRHDLRLQEKGEELPAHGVRDDPVVQTEDVQGGDAQRGAVEALVPLAGAAEPRHQHGEAHSQRGGGVALLEGAEHGHQGGALTEAQDAVEWPQLLHCHPHRRHALLQTQALRTGLLGAEAPPRDIREPPAPGVRGPAGPRHRAAALAC